MEPLSDSALALLRAILDGNCTAYVILAQTADSDAISYSMNGPLGLRVGLLNVALKGALDEVANVRDDEASPDYEEE